jgi:hypothetical protein
MKIKEGVKVTNCFLLNLQWRAPIYECVCFHLGDDKEDSDGGCGCLKKEGVARLNDPSINRADLMAIRSLS